GQRHGSGSASGPGALGQDRLADALHLVVGYVPEAGPGDGLHGGKDAAYQVGTARPDVLVGGVDERLERDAQRLVAAHLALPKLLQRIARVLRARALRVEVGLLVAAAGDVVLEQPSGAGLLVEAGEDRHHHETLHRRRQIHADHLAQAVGFALEREVL